jgi:hypothetical protein
MSAPETFLTDLVAEQSHSLIQNRFSPQTQLLQAKFAYASNKLMQS